MNAKEIISQGKAYLGIELGSTRIKAVLTDDSYTPIAGGSHEWENRLENGYWTYSLDDIHKGIQSCYSDLCRDCREKYGVVPESFGAMGISAMMHGIMPFDENDGLMVPFRTWRNTCTAEAAAELTELLKFNMPQRWSISHYYQSVLKKEPYVQSVKHITTLAGYIHYRLTGVRAVGVGEASGMFPITDGSYDKDMLAKTNKLLESKGVKGNLEELLPTVMTAGEKGAALTEEGAKFLDVSGKLKAGVPVCPPEGDAGTGMAATNSVRPCTGNISAGTSVFAMLVLDKPMTGYYPEIDVVTTPDGAPVAMVHCNNCCSEIDAWVKMFGEFAALTGHPIDKSELYETLYKNAMTGDTDCGGVTAYNFLSGEPVVGVDEGRPSYFRTPDSKMNLSNFFRAQLYSTVSALKIGMDILFEKEKVTADRFMGHGGLFKAAGAAQQVLADGLGTPVSTMRTAGEGGAWGMALLAAYMIDGEGMSLPDFLDKKVFTGMEKTEKSPDKAGAEGFAKYIEGFKNGLKN